MTRLLIAWTLAAVALGRPLAAQDADAALREQAAAALKRAAAYWRENVASHGGYVYHYTPDLSRRWGEGEFTADTVFVQPPGTPAVGMAYLRAYEATGDRYYLDAAREAAEALVAGQLESGGWAQAIHFAPPADAKRYGKYRKRPGGNWNTSSLDDGQTQAAIEFLARVDKALNFEHAEIHEATLHALDALLAAQFPNGAFPQSWQGPAADHPPARAKYPDYDWKTERRVKEYWTLYTLNDGLAGTVADTLMTADEVYNDRRYRESLQKLGDFLRLAQMPEPQPAWCQQYNYDMTPAWARKFEPPAITGSESQDVMRTLIAIAEYTGDERYLEPIPRAIVYLEKSLLPDGRVARFYELRTNRPLYMDKDYQLTYDGSGAPGHYSWTAPAKLDQIRKEYEAAKFGRRTRSEPSLQRLREGAARAVHTLDEQGRWVATYGRDKVTGQPDFEPGFRYLSSDLFNRNVAALSEYIEAADSQN